MDLISETKKRELRPHQTEAINLLYQSFGTGLRRVVLQAPTGFGKTLTSAKIIERSLAKGKRILFTVPRKDLVDQAIFEFEREGVTHIGVMQGDHPRVDLSAPVQVATLQTLNHRRKKFDRPFEMVIVDECHERFDVVPAMMKEWPETFWIGLSATPWAKGMNAYWQDLVCPATIGYLIGIGNLSQFTAYAPEVPDLSGVKVQAGEYREDDLMKVMGEHKIVGNVVHTWLEKAQNRPTLVFAVNRAHAAQLQAEFIRNGVSAGYIDCMTPKLDRERLARKFRSGEVKVACSVRTLTTGIDWPVSCIVDAQPTKSEMLHVQKIGRGLRVNPGTEDCLILDHAGNSLRLGLVTDIHHDCLVSGEKGAKSEPKEEKLPKECKNCGVLYTGMKCPACGHERRPPVTEAAEGDLVEITSKQKKSAWDKQEFWSMALWLDDYRERGGRLAKGLYKGQFGVWPRGLSDRRKPANQAFMNYERSRRIAYAKKMEKERGTK